LLDLLFNTLSSRSLSLPLRSIGICSLAPKPLLPLPFLTCPSWKKSYVSECKPLLASTSPYLMESKNPKLPSKEEKEVEKKEEKRIDLEKALIEETALKKGIFFLFLVLDYLFCLE
jgi:hypothetical protein